jgi:hypothetical protein
MLDPVASKGALRSLFHRVKVAQLGTLFRVLKTRARRSVMRRLKSEDYLSSYTHTGRYYTLREIPRFDQFGLWHCGDVGFCRMGTLKAAVTELVERSEAGRTLQELKELLRVRVQNALLDRVRARRIGRKLIDKKKWLYVSAEPARAAKQWARRQAQEERTAEALGPLTSAMMIEVLVEVLLASTVQVSAQEVARRLSRRGVTVALQHVEWVFEHYGLGKKKPRPGLPRSPL